MIFLRVKAKSLLCCWAEKTGLTPDGVKYHLDKLREQGVIRHVGATKKGYWEVMENYE